jgi:hypothetical protein
VPKKLALLVALWLSFECQNKSVYQNLSKESGMSAPESFNAKVLGKFRECFDSTKAAWAFFTNTEAIASLRSATALNDYVDKMPVEKDALDLKALFHVEDLDGWLEDRFQALNKILIDNASGKQDVQIKFCSQMEKLLVRLGRNGPRNRM